MSPTSRESTARVVDLAVVRAERHTPRRSDGHRLGNHGNRAGQLTRTKTVNDLRDILTFTGQVTRADKEAAATAAGVDVRSVNRWWSRELDRQFNAARRHGAGHTTDETVAVPAHLPAWLYRHAEPGKLQLTPAEIAFFAQHSTTKAAIEAVRADPGHRLSKYGTSTIYAAYANVTAPLRRSARYGAKAGRRIEATYPLTSRDTVNETWSIDEYDLKLSSNLLDGAIVEPKVLIVRERCSGLPLSYVVLPGAATGQDTGVVLAAAAIGYTVTHPNDLTRTLHVRGVARHLVSDQGAPFLGDTGFAAARRLGIGLTPVPSHQPQANGDHEVMHQSLLRHFADGPGSRRGWTDRAGNRLDHGLLPYETVLAEVEAWFISQVSAQYTSGHRKGRSRLAVYAEHVDSGDVYTGHDLTAEDEGAVAYPVGDRKYDPTRGVQFEGRYWLAPRLANAAKPGDTIRLRRLVNDQVLYAYDTKGRFLGLLTPRDDADVADINAVHHDRVRRESFVRDRVAKPRAQTAAVDAQVAQDEVAERLADAAEQRRNQREQRTITPLADTDVENAVGSDHTPNSDRTEEAADAATNARAARYANRKHPHTGGPSGGGPSAP